MRNVGARDQNGQVPGYRRILAVPGVSRLLGFAVLARLPHAAATIVLTLHVVLGLGRGYGAAGLVGSGWTIGVAIGSPWRGRVLDKVGVRRAVLPSVLVEGLAWAAIPFVGYRLLLPVVFVAGVMAAPTFTVVRQSLSVLVDDDRQHTAYALDSIGTEITYMIAPAVAVVLATTWSEAGTVLVVAGVTVLAGVALLVLNPPITRAGLDPASAVAAAVVGSGEPPALRARLVAIFTPSMLAVLAASMAAVAVLAGTEVSIVAQLRGHGQGNLAWVVYMVWSLTSIAGGLLFGAARARTPVFTVLLALGLLTAPVGLASGVGWLAVAMLPAGFFCAPTLSATAAQVSRLVPEALRGEAMGWYSTSVTAGAALGAPLAGVAIDGVAPWAGFAVVGAVGAVVAGVGLLLVAWTNDRPGPAGPGAQSGVSPTRRRAVPMRAV